jgi:hypothetical protein
VQGGQANPEHRHALGFQDADHLIDFPGVEFDPAFLAKLINAVWRARALVRRDRRRRIVVVGGIVRGQFGIDRLVLGLGGSIGCASRFRAGFRLARLGLRLGFGVLLVFVALFVGRLAVRFFDHGLAQRHAVIEPEHHDDGVGLLGGENTPGRGGPIGRIALGLIFDEAGDGLVLADHAHVRPLGIGILETRGEPVGHRIAEHQYVALRHRLALSGGGALEKSSRITFFGACCCCWKGAKKSPPNQPPPPRCCDRCGGPPKLPKLKNCAEAGPAIPTNSAEATASAASGPGSVKTRKKDIVFGMRLGRNGWLGNHYYSGIGPQAGRFLT